MTAPQDIVILLDNSDKSIDGDFFPNRLDAQKAAVRDLIKYFPKRTQISIGVLGVNHIGIAGVNNIGIATCLTTEEPKLDKALLDIEPSGPIQLYQGIKLAFLVLNRHNDETKNKKKRIIIFVGSQCNLSEDESEAIQKKAIDQKVAIDIIVFGDDVQILDILTDIVGNLNEKLDEHSTFIIAKHDLSHTVLDSLIGDWRNARFDEFENDPELKRAMEIINQEELYAAMQESRESMAANQLQAQDESDVQKEDDEVKVTTQDKVSNDEEEEEEEEDYSTDELNDPDLKEAIDISKRDLEGNDEQKSDDEN